MKALNRKKIKKFSQGSALILAMVFLTVFSTLAVGLSAMSMSNVRIADNNHKANQALAAAMSGLECAKQVASSFTPIGSTGDLVTTDQANATWLAFIDYLRAAKPGGSTVSYETRFTDADGSGSNVSTSQITFDESGAAFTLRFKRYDADPDRIVLISQGMHNDINRKISMDFSVSKDCTVLEYAVASRGRMIITGDTTINGDMFSTWYKYNWHPPFEVTSESVINGKLGTTISYWDLYKYDNQMETLDSNGDPIYDEFGNRVIDPYDSVQGQIDGIEYDIPEGLMPGLDAEDYDTTAYRDMCTAIPSSYYTVKEYFPHYPGRYDLPKESWNTKLYRDVYSAQTFTNALLPKGRNALFQDCTFEGVLYIEADSNASNTGKCNNVRFDNCQFNGIIVTSVPKNNFIQWRHNCLYFTGGADFDNNYMEEATILAPNFNVNLGNTRELEVNENSILKGAIVGGIVDIRGNAIIEGTIISMYDTYAHSSGYVTNIGFADDGGSEGGVPGDVGTIRITPAKGKMLPGGIISDIVVVPQQNTYKEIM